jgi:hypothetical protein
LTADRHRIGVVVFAAVPDGQQPYPGGQLGGHVDDFNVVGAQPSGQWCPDPGGSFDRPAGVGPSAREPAQRPIALRLTGTLMLASGCNEESTAAAVHDPLCGSTAITT